MKGSADCVDGRIEYARGFFNQGLCPEEWVARHSHRLGCWSLDEVVYPDAELGQWIAEVSKLLFGGLEIRRSLQERYLTPDEISKIEIEEAEL